MTVMEEVLLEEYMRALRIERLLNSEIAELPKGSIQKKKIKGREYFYLQYRSELTKKLEKRKENISALKEIQKTKAQIEKALGKDFLNEHTAEGIYQVY